MSTPQAPARASVYRKVRRASTPLLVSLCVLICAACVGPNVDRVKTRDLAEARQAFAANLAAIQQKDLEAYLAGYLATPEFLFIGPDGASRGFAPFAAARRAQPDFPDSLAAGEPELTWLAPGVVQPASAAKTNGKPSPSRTRSKRSSKAEISLVKVE